MVLKPLSESDLKAEIIVVARHVAQAALFILCDERQAIGNAVLERENLVLVFG